VKDTTAIARMSDPGLVESEAEFAAHLEKVNEKNRQALARLKPHELAQLETWLRTRTHDKSPVRPPSTPAIGRAPREARNDRPRGSRRSSARRSSERSGDSGDSEGGSEPPPRACACGCGLDISHRALQARYASDSHAAYARQRRKRDRDRDWSREISGRDTYLRFDLEPPRRFEDLRKRIEDGCRCNGHHIADGEDRHCIKCGHRRGAALPFARFIAARSAEARRARKPVA
jgi:hypothetical protein